MNRQEGNRIAMYLCGYQLNEVHLFKNPGPNCRHDLF